MRLLFRRPSGKLTPICDGSNHVIDGPTALAFSGDAEARFGALGWNKIAADNNIHGDLRLFQACTMLAI